MSEDEPDEEVEDDRERDPFGQLDESVADRDGDPFESLSTDEDDPSPGFEADAGEDAVEAGEPTAGEFREVTEPSVGPTTGQTPEDDPFSEAPPDFAEVDLEDVDEDAVWEALSSAQARGSVADVRDRTYAEVSKHSYCERCEYFTEPPEADCTHDGTDILEFVDMETVRVVDCPIVDERRQLEREG